MKVFKFLAGLTAGAVMLGNTAFSGFVSQASLSTEQEIVASAAEDDTDIPVATDDTTTTYDLGDVDGDGTITQQDLRLAQTAYANLSVGLDSGLTSAQESAADVNEDGAITIEDTYLIFAYERVEAAGLSHTWDGVLEELANIVSSADATPTITMESVTISLSELASNDNQVSVDITSDTDFCFLGFGAWLDDGLTYASNSKTYCTSVAANGNFLWYSTVYVNSGNAGTVGTLTFEVMPEVGVYYIETTIYDYYGDETGTVNGVVPTVVSGYIKVVENDLGDVDGSGIINVQDAYLTQTAYTNLSVGLDFGLTSAQESAADVNEDGVITMEDAFLIDEYYA